MAAGRFVKWPYEWPMREWQEKLEKDFRAVRMLKEDYLVVACPGAGKTDGALPLGVDLLQTGQAERVVIVCPTDVVCEQWIEKAARFGIQLTRAGAETRDFHGVVVTYAQVVNGWETHRRFCQVKTVVVFDEIHHCADGLKWGEAIRQAFEPAVYRIALSGTPFRSDNHAIPFIVYEENVCRPDFIYGYQRALDDEVCRLAFFPTIDGSAEWLINGELRHARLEEELSESDASSRFRTILDPQGDWIATTIKQASERIEVCRRLGHSDAGELWLCVDQNHAKAVAALIERTTGEAPVLAISEDPKAAGKIDSFRRGKQKRLVSVRMVCEGADIPRLRVVVYATNILTEMFFRQALGRVVRWVEGLDEQACYMFLPRIPQLVQFALEVIEERTHHLRDAPPAAEREARERSGQTALFERSLFQPISSEGTPSHVIGSGEEYSQEAIEQAKTVIQFLRTNVQPEELTMALVKAGIIRAGSTGAPRPETAQDFEKPLEYRKADLRSKIGRLVNRWADLDQVGPDVIHREWIRLSKIRTKDATIEDLQQKYEWAKDNLADAQRRQLDGG